MPGGDLRRGGPAALVGRDAELRRVRAGLGEGTRVAVVLGMAGAGKTALLDVACRAAAAEGARVLRVTGHTSDRDLPFAGLADLLSTTGDPTARRLLEELTTDSAGPGTGPLAFRLDVLAWLEEAGDGHPLLLTLDDAQWIDRSSLSVLGFVANRAATSGISVLVAVRDDAVPPGFEAHPRVVLEPLDEAHSATLLRRSGLVLHPFARSVVIERAAGNPLALLELGRAAAAARAGDLAAAGTTATEVERTFAALLPGLPEATRDVLLLAAAGAEDLAVLGRAAAEPLTDLEPAERAGLVRVVGRQVRFRHPLARSAVYTSVTAAERARAHDRLARAYVDDPDRRTWHRAEATVAPDEGVAASLAESAGRAERRGANAEAARLMARAAELSPDRAVGDGRMLAALSVSSPTFQFDWLLEMATRVRDTTDDPTVRARASHHIAYALAQTWQQAEAQRALLDALGQLVGVGEEYGWATLTTLASLTYQSGADTAIVARWLERYRREAPPVEGHPVPVVEAAEAWIRAAIDPLARPPDLVALVREAPPLDSTRPPALTSVRDMLLGATAWLLDETDAAAVRLGAAVSVMRRINAPGQLVQTVMALGHVHLDAAALDEADDTGRLLGDIAEAESLRYVGDVGMQLRARVAALRGDAVTARRLTAEILRNLEIGQCLALESNTRVALGHAHVAENDMTGCYRQLRALFHADGRPVHDHVSYRTLADLVSAAVRTGHGDDVRRIVAVAHERIPRPTGRHRLILARADALLADHDARDLFDHAVGDPAAGQWTFDLANARLEYGAWLRRRQAPGEARAQLSAALEAFERIGARPWADLARVELRAAGIATVRPAQAAVWDALTAQERQVVRLAATGMSNPEIGRLLFLSPRTVSAHLYKAFPKLHVTSRAQLRDIVDRHDNATPQTR